jgi:hypothetical protein
VATQLTTGNGDDVCRLTTCRTCSKITWAGCGQHVQQVMSGVPQAERCTCTDADRAAARGRSFLDRLLRR